MTEEHKNSESSEATQTLVEFPTTDVLLEIVGEKDCNLKAFYATT